MFMQRSVLGLHVRHAVPLRLWLGNNTGRLARVQTKASFLIWMYKKKRDILQSMVSVSVKKT